MAKTKEKNPDKIGALKFFSWNRDWAMSIGENIFLR